MRYWRSHSIRQLLRQKRRQLFEIRIVIDADRLDLKPEQLVDDFDPLHANDGVQSQVDEGLRRVNFGRREVQRFGQRGSQLLQQRFRGDGRTLRLRALHRHNVEVAQLHRHSDGSCNFERFGDDWGRDMSGYCLRLRLDGALDPVTFLRKWVARQADALRLRIAMHLTPVELQSVDPQLHQIGQLALRHPPLHGLQEIPIRVQHCQRVFVVLHLSLKDLRGIRVVIAPCLELFDQLPRAVYDQPCAKVHGFTAHLQAVSQAERSMPSSARAQEMSRSGIFV